ncbi:MAG: cobalamin-dependent protein [Candidatus Marinimicrobia bacterium]|nr:cobalamin-dependent protein [Candidatus Neomarinimicrobiota bacterium]
MFNICLIQPPIEDFYGTDIRNIPLGLLSIGAMLKKKHSVQLLDLRHSKSHKKSIPKDLSAVASYYRPEDASPFGLYKHYSRFGLRNEDIATAIPAACDVFIISALFSTYIYEALEVINIIRRKKPEAIIVAGGSGAMFHTAEFFDSSCDFIIQGEGELAAEVLLNELQKPQADFATIPNLIWRIDGKIQKNPVQIIENLDDLPAPDYSIPGTPQYHLSGKRHAMLMASRGCVYQCRFCCIHHVFGNKYRLRSVENILTEIGDKINAGFRSFDFEDDHFGGSKKWLNQLLDGIIEEFAQYDLSFQAMNGITAGNLDETILKKMKQAGFSGINLSLVTPDRSRQNALNRPFNTPHFKTIVDQANKLGLQVTAYLIIGLPGDMPEDNLKSILFLARLPVLIGPSLYYLTPGTADFDTFQKISEKPLSPHCYRSSYFPCERPDYSRTAAMTLFRICRIINFIKAIEKQRCTVSEYKIENDKISFFQRQDGKESQIALGFALLEILATTGKIFGTTRKQDNQYPLIEEQTDPALVQQFLSAYPIETNR